MIYFINTNFVRDFIPNNITSLWNLYYTISISSSCCWSVLNQFLQNYLSTLTKLAWVTSSMLTWLAWRFWFCSLLRYDNSVCVFILLILSFVVYIFDSFLISSFSMQSTLDFSSFSLKVTNSGVYSMFLIFVYPFMYNINSYRGTDQYQSHHALYFWFRIYLYVYILKNIFIFDFVYRY